MTAELQDVYRQQVLDHSRHPHNRRRPDDVDREVTGFNPLCGDKVTVYLHIDAGTVVDVAFEGTGCAITLASASMMTDALRGLTEADALAAIGDFGTMFADDAEPANPQLQEVRALQGVRDYPSRIKCATLPWSTAEAALHDSNEQVTTE